MLTAVSWSPRLEAAKLKTLRGLIAPWLVLVAAMLWLSARASCSS
jgi:hypothetical protein